MHTNEYEELKGIRVYECERTLIASALSGRLLWNSVQLLHRIVDMLQTGLPLNHPPKHYQKLIRDVSWVIGNIKDTAIGDSPVADGIENDALCPDGMCCLQSGVIALNIPA